MNGRYADRWSDPNEPAWVVEPTTEWHPQYPGQRYPGDIGVTHQPPPRGRATVTGRAEVPPLAPTRPDGTYLGRSWADEPPEEPAVHGRSWADDEPGETPSYGRARSDTRSADASSYGRNDSADPRTYDHEPYRRPLPEPPRRDDRRSSESDRRTAWSDRRPGDERGPAREAAWHRDQPSPDRYDGRRQRPEPTERDRGYPGTPPVSPAPRSDSGRMPEPDDVPRRRGTHERPAAAYDRHPVDGYGGRPTRDHDGRTADDRTADDRTADGADQWAPVDGRTRHRADGYPDRTGDDGRRPERRYRADEGAGAAPSPNGGRRHRPEPDLPDHPRRDDDRRRPDSDPRRQQPRETAARAEAYPDRRPREEARPDAYREDGPRDHPYREERPHDNAYREPRAQPGPRPDGTLPWPPPGPVRPDRTREPGHRTEPHRGVDPVTPSRPDARPERQAVTPSRYDERQTRPAATAPSPAGRATPIPPPPSPVSPAAPDRDRQVPAAPVSPAPDVPISGPPAARLRLEYLPAPVDPPAPDERSEVPPPPERRTPGEPAPTAGAHPTAPPRYPGPDTTARPADQRRGGEPTPDRRQFADPSGSTTPTDRRPTPHSPDRPASGQRPHSTDRPHSTNRPHSTDRPASGQRPESPDRMAPSADARPPVAPPPTWQVPHPAATPPAPTPAAPEPPEPDAGAAALPLAPGTPRRYVPPPSSEGPLAPVRGADEVAGVRGPDAWFSPAQPADPDPREPAPERQSSEPADHGSTMSEPDLSTTVDHDPVDRDPLDRDPLDQDPVDHDPSAPPTDVAHEPSDEHGGGSTPADAPEPVPTPPTRPTVDARADDPQDDAQTAGGPTPAHDDRPVSGAPATATSHQQAEVDQPMVTAQVVEDTDPVAHDTTVDAQAYVWPSEAEADPHTTASTDGSRTDDWPDDLAPPAPSAMSDDNDAPVSGAPVSADHTPSTLTPVSAPPAAAPPAAAAPAAAAPVSAPPVSAEPVSAPLASVSPPVSAPPATLAPVSAPPAAPAPVSAPPASTEPAHAPPVSAAPTTPSPTSTAPTPAPPVSAPPAPTQPARAAPAPAEPTYAPPISAPPAPTQPTYTPPISAPPAPTPPAHAAPAANVPGPRTGPRGEDAPVSAPPGDAAPAATRPSLADPGDPEQVLAAYRWRLDPVTLREELTEPDHLRAIRRRLTEKLGSAIDNRARARLLSLRAVASRILGDLDDALADGRLALTYAEATGELRRTSLAQARLAHVLRWRGNFAEADQLFAQANSVELPDRLRAALHEHAGRSCYDQGRLMEACQHFEQALDLRGAGDAELLDRVRVALDAVAVRATADGFGPYRRGRDEVLDRDRPPVPERDGPLWGYTGQDGDQVIPARYAEAQPFHDGLAWVRRPDTDRWSLINLLGTTVIPPSYRAAHPFSDGLAWVVGEGGWTAIDATGAVQVAPNFAEVRQFRRGLAAVRREGWGAVDRTGRIVVPTRYHGFVTELADGRRVDGFTDEGLAVVDVAGRRGVVDRTGAVLVPPTHPMLVIHPVAFLVGSGGRWGALDRRGEPLIDLVHRDRDEVLAEIDRLLTDANPVL
ncbi:WG repeat-containing protein [Micromonospora sp. NPDC048839]|uniref:WG repeat-containing protein n=1 Tax=Micromonospora sp. NPDC048839 TaxID=3155641 RepID=UPI0033F825A9